MNASHHVRLTTSHGNITLRLDAENAPDTVANFERYVRDGHYDQTIFHRVIPGFMIQGGGFTEDMRQKETRAPIPHEGEKASKGGLKNRRGSIAMARTGDPHSATAQFFINVVDNAFLDFSAPSGNAWGYCVFGEVIDGMETVDRIKTVQTGSKGMHQDVPKEAVLIEKAELVEA
ncbi:MAG: peptidyl-prolyl cis-trans isomerase [Zoogloeaceae bacterium]|jgi:peptidyl-prolyl cis-trans isomerase B (cyclophilin B)|nr:peptidyl-prolyl cis-trans isomerase [Zoogloeaceae bacterium]